VRNAASRQRGAVAEGSAFQIDTFNLTDITEFSPTPVPTLAGVQVWVLDAYGRLPVGLTMAGPLFLQAVMPEAIAPGTATVIVQPPQVPALSQSVRILATAPGLYSNMGTAAPLGYASDISGNVFPLVSCPDKRDCFITHLPVSSTPGGLDFVLYATGVRAASGNATVRIGTHMLNSVGTRPHPDIAGVDELHFH